MVSFIPPVFGVRQLAAALFCGLDSENKAQASLRTSNLKGIGDCKLKQILCLLHGKTLQV
jgi:hypothetical protein